MSACDYLKTNTNKPSSLITSQKAPAFRNFDTQRNDIKFRGGYYIIFFQEIVQ